MSFDDSKEMGFFVHCLGLRCAISNELPTGGVLDTQKFKSLVSGGVDVITGHTVRGINKAGIVILNQKELPVFNRVDHALAERTRVIHYKYSYVDDPKLPHERQQDGTLLKFVQSPIARVAYSTGGARASARRPLAAYRVRRFAKRLFA
jgi:hypothetical protein